MYDLKLTQKTFFQVRQIVNSVQEVDPKTGISSTNILYALNKLNNDKKDYTKLTLRLQQIIRDTQIIKENIKNPLVNRKELKIDIHKSLDTLFENYMKMKAALQEKQETKRPLEIKQGIKKEERPAQNEQVNHERIQIIISTLFDLVNQQLSQKGVKNMQTNIKNAAALEAFDKEVLNSLLQKNLNLQLSIKRLTKDTSNFEQNALVEFVKVLSNSKVSQDSLNKQYTKLPNEGKKLFDPLVEQIKRLRTAIKEITDQMLRQNTKIKLPKQKRDTLQTQQIKQQSIDSLLDEAGQYKSQNLRIESVLGQLAKMVKLSQKQPLNPSWKKPIATEIEKLKAKFRAYFLELLEHIFSQPKAFKNTEDRRVEDRPSRQAQQYQRDMEKLQAENLKLIQKLGILSSQKEGILLELQAQQRKTKQKTRQVDALQTQLQALQKQAKQKSTQNDKYLSAEKYSRQVDLKKMCQQLQQQVRKLDEELNALKQQLRQQNNALSQNQQTIAQLQRRLKDTQKSSSKNLKDESQQVARLKQELTSKNSLIQELNGQKESAVRQSKDLQRQLNSINEKLSLAGGQSKNKDSLIIATLRESQKLNKSSYNQLNKLNVRLTAELKATHQQLQKLQTDKIQLQGESQTNRVNLVRLESIQGDYLKLEQNYKNLNKEYQLAKQQLAQSKKNKADATSNNKQLQLERTQSELKQQQLILKRFKENLLKETTQRDQTIISLKLQIDEINSKLQKFNDNSEAARLKNRTLDLEREIQSLKSENFQLKGEIQAKERQIVERKIEQANLRV